MHHPAERPRPTCDIVWDLSGACWHAGPPGEHASLDLTLPALTLTRTYAAHGERLFRLSPLSDLGDNRVNRQIAATLRREPQRFHLLNHGLTAVCRDFDLRESAASPRLTIGGLQIIDGVQTTHALCRAASRDAAALAGCFVNLRLIAPARTRDAAATDSGLLPRITAATNRHTALLCTDDLSHRPEQQRSRRAFAALDPPWFYEAKRGDWNRLTTQERDRFRRWDGVASHRRITPRRLAQAARAASGAPGHAKARPGDFLASPSDSAVYQEIFSAQAQQLLLPLRLLEQAGLWARTSAPGAVAAQAPWLGWVKHRLVFAVYGVLAERLLADQQFTIAQLAVPFLPVSAAQRLLHIFDDWAPDLVAACANAFDHLIAGMSREPDGVRRFFQHDDHLPALRAAVRAAIRREDRLRAAHGLPALASLLPSTPDGGARRDSEAA